MVARLLLLLIVAFAAPAAVAMPACHADMPAMADMEMTGMSGHHAPTPAKATPVEPLCVGCIAPATIHPPVISRHAMSATLPPPAFAPGGLRLAPLPPATPPPRLG